MKTLYLFLCLVAGALTVSAETMTVYLTSGSQLYMRSSWSETHDLFRVCGLGGNKQFNYTYSALVDKKVPDADLMLKGKYPGRFHWCGDSVGVMHLYPDPAKRSVYILSGNHGYTGSIVTRKDHGYTQKDVGKELIKGHWIAAIVSKDAFKVLPTLSSKQVPAGATAKTFHNFQGTRTLSRTYYLDGKVLPPKKILKGKQLTVVEKTGMCTFEALTAAAYKHDAVNDFYATVEYNYNFYPNGSCRAEGKITYTRDVCIMGTSIMQDSDMELGKYDFYEKYIPKVKKFTTPASTPWRNAPVRYYDGKKMVTDTRTYDFEGIQDMTFKRKGQARTNPRYEIAVKGGLVNPADLPDRWIEFLGKVENGKRVRKIGNVLGLDPTYGALRHSERAKNRLAFIIPSWHKTYPAHFSPGKKMVPKGTVLDMRGFRCYFNPEKIGDASVLFYIPQAKGIRVFADFHKSVKDYTLPFAADAKVTILEKTPSVTLKGNKVSVSGNYGRIVVQTDK